MKLRAFTLLCLFAFLLTLHPAATTQYMIGRICAPSPWEEYAIVTASILLYAGLIYLYLQLFCRFQYKLTQIVQQKYPEATRNAPKPSMPKKATLCYICIIVLMFISVFGFIRTKNDLLREAIQQNWQHTANMCMACGITHENIYDITTATRMPMEQRAKMLRHMLQQTDIEANKPYLTTIYMACSKTPASRALLPVFEEFGIPGQLNHISGANIKTPNKDGAAIRGQLQM